MLSIIIPVLNEQESLRELHRQIDAVLSANSIDAELIFIDDGSTDGSWDVIEELARDDERVFGIRFRRNFGKAAALTAGMRSVRGEIVLQMDAVIAIPIPATTNGCCGRQRWSCGQTGSYR